MVVVAYAGEILCSDLNEGLCCGVVIQPSLCRVLVVQLLQLIAYVHTYVCVSDMLGGGT